MLGVWLAITRKITIGLLLDTTLNVEANLEIIQKFLGLLEEDESYC